MIKVENIEHLKELASRENGDFVDFCVILSSFTRSGKRIQYSYQFDEFCIIHEIDESYQELATIQLGTETNLMEALEKNALFKC